MKPKEGTRPFIVVGSYPNQSAAKAAAAAMRKDTGQDWRAKKAGNSWGIRRVS